MQTLEVLKRKIEVAVELRSVVRTMKTLSAVAIRQYERAEESLADYYRTVELGLEIALANRPADEPVMPTVSGGAVLAIVIGSDRGLCGQFNEQLASFALSQLAQLPERGKRAILFGVGDRLTSRLADAAGPLEWIGTMPGSVAGITPLVQDTLIAIEAHRQVHPLERVVLFHNRRKRGVSYTPVKHQLLPREGRWFEALRNRRWGSRMLPIYLIDAALLVRLLIRQYLFVSLYRAYVESLASENASRITSMQAAEKNIGDRLTELRAEFNDLRQTSITSELLDIVTGAEALAPRRRGG